MKDRSSSGFLRQSSPVDLVDLVDLAAKKSGKKSGKGKNTPEELSSEFAQLRYIHAGLYGQLRSLLKEMEEMRSQLTASLQSR